jgi:hypothetical protein
VEGGCDDRGGHAGTWRVRDAGAGAAGGASEHAERFLAEVVTARFPSGFTVLDAGGQWRGQDGKVYREASRIVVVLHPSSREANRAIEEIRREFKARFGGEVLRSDTPAMVSY